MSPTTEASYSARTQPPVPKPTAAELLAVGQGFTLTAQEYRRIDGGRQPLYGCKLDALR